MRRRSAISSMESGSHLFAGLPAAAGPCRHPPWCEAEQAGARVRNAAPALHLDGRVIVLADPVRDRLSAYLNGRNQRWPNTANTHLFVTEHTGRRTEECSKRWIWLTIGPGLSAAAIREDRILDEAHATGGDVRRLADLLGLSIQAGTRYTGVLSHPDLTRNERV